MKIYQAVLIILLISLGNGCSSPQIKTVDKIIYITTPLPLPIRPVLPIIPFDALSCLSSDTSAKLMNRDIARRQYAEELETIIKSTRSN
jgi:hypothetical protein